MATCVQLPLGKIQEHFFARSGPDGLVLVTVLNALVVVVVVSTLVFLSLVVLERADLVTRRHWKWSPRKDPG